MFGITRHACYFIICNADPSKEVMTRQLHTHLTCLHKELKEISVLLHKELLLEWRQKFAFGGLLLYVLATVFVCYLSFQHIIDERVWNALLWLIILFAAVNVSAKSFLQENRGRLLYLYTLASPQAIIISKMLYNALLLLLFSLLCFGFYSLFLSNMVSNGTMFLCVLVLGSIGISGLLTMVSAIAGKASSQNGSALMAILAFPLMMPLLLTIIKLSQHAIDGTEFSLSEKYFLLLISLDIIVVALAWMLFPYLWKD